MSDLVRPDQSDFRIVPPKDNEVNEYLLKLTAHDQSNGKLTELQCFPFLDVKVNGATESVAGFLIDNDLLCTSDVSYTDGTRGRLFFALTSRGSGPSRHWTLAKGRLSTPDDTDEHFMTFGDRRALLRQLLAQR